MEKRFNLKLEGEITLLSPLSHIGESIGTDSYLSTDVIIGPDGTPVECFLYSGNAFRGILRDAAAVYLLEKLGAPQIPLDKFHLLFSGGSIGGTQSIDIDQARVFRKALPAFSIFGGGIGNQIMEGKLKVGALYPLTEECQHIIPERLRNKKAPSWKKWTYEHSYTRRDDTKQERLRDYLCDENGEQKRLESGKAQQLLGNEQEEKKPKKEKEQAQQMRYTVELMAAGAKFYQIIFLQDMTELELGAFVSALVEWGKMPFLGGKSGVGHGLCKAEYSYIDIEKGEPANFISLGSDLLKLSEPAKKAKEQYDEFLLRIYNDYLSEKKSDIKLILGGGE